MAESVRPVELSGSELPRLLPGQQLHRFPERALYGAACALVTPDLKRTNDFTEGPRPRDEKSGRSFRPPAPDFGWQLDGSGATFLLIGMLDISLAWYRSTWGTRVGVRDHQLDVRLLPVVTLGLALLGWLIGRSRLKRGVQIFSVLLILAALMILAALVIYALNLPLAFRSVQDPLLRTGLEEGGDKGDRQGVLYPVACVIIASQGAAACESFAVGAVNIRTARCMTRRVLRSLTSPRHSRPSTDCLEDPQPLHEHQRGGDNFKTCASLSITWSGTTATVDIRNLGTQGEVFLVRLYPPPPAPRSPPHRSTRRSEAGSSRVTPPTSRRSASSPATWRRTASKASDNGPFSSRSRSAERSRLQTSRTRLQHPCSVGSERLFHQAHRRPERVMTVNDLGDFRIRPAARRSCPSRSP